MHDRSWQARAHNALAGGQAEVARQCIAEGAATDTAEGQFLLGLCAQQLLQHEAAIRHFELALRWNPGLVTAQHNVALSYRSLGRLEDAEAHWRRLIQAAPQFALAYAGLGNLLRAQATAANADRRQTCLAEATALHVQAVALEPHEPGHAHNLFLTLSSRDAWQEAEAMFPNLAEAHPQAAHFAELAARVLVRAGQFPQAIVFARDALTLQPNNVEARISLATALRETGQAEAAEGYLKEACTLSPGHAVAAFNLAQHQCFLGRWSEGLAGIAADRVRQNEARRACKSDGPVLWQGDRAPGAHLLLLAEQGLGDTLQFIRYAQLARQRVGRITLVPPSGLAASSRWLKDLLSRTAGIDQVLTPAEPVPVAQVFAPLFILPHICGPFPDKVWAPQRYVWPDPDRAAFWARQLGPVDGRLRVALAWQGNPLYRGDARRSIPLEAFATLLAGVHRPVRWMSLQKGVGATQLQTRSASLQPIEDWGQTIDVGPDAFVDTAALLENVDLVISSDTSLPHLAAALGRPTWLLLSAVPDWRWQHTGTESPWYPSMRVFRQPAPGDWTEVMHSTAAAVDAMCASPVSG